MKNLTNFCLKNLGTNRAYHCRYRNFSYLVHCLYFLVSQDIIDLTSKLTKNPILYPFSFILIYEVFLLVFYLPSSTSKYIGKQYEIITLIVIRRLFKDIGHIELSSGWFKLENDLQFIYDVITTLIFFSDSTIL
jgi:hypothetical protein